MSSPIVQIKQGKLEGIVTKSVEGKEYYVFPGIPYAEPPIGELRFKEPRSPKAWSGIRRVEKVSRKCAQYDPFSNRIYGSEDCLYLNVATKCLSGKRPVMVWVHSGAFVTGNAERDIYGPDYLIQHDVVLVTINYRLGCFGFLNLNIPEAAGNQGLKDQVAALTWVRNNIVAFGGEPENVTIFGGSAGASSIHFLAASPLCDGLFHKAIIQSGACLNPWTFRDNPIRDALHFCEIMGNKTNDANEAWKFLMSAPLDRLMVGQKKFLTNNSRMIFQHEQTWAPSIDLNSLVPLIPEAPRVLAKRGFKIPLILGYMSDEGIVGLLGPDYEDNIIKLDKPTDFTNFLARQMHIFDLDKMNEISNDVKKYYFGDESITAKEKINGYVKLIGDVHFTNGVQAIADLHMELPTPTYLFRFSYIAGYPTLKSFLGSTKIKGACHCDEIGALFHSHFMSGNKPYPAGTRDRLIMQRMTKMWTNFAKTGNPTPELDEKITCKWEPLRKGEKNYLDISDNLVMGKNPDQANWNFWKPIMATL